MEEFVIFPLEKTRVKPGTVLIETVLSGDYLYHQIWIQTYLGFIVLLLTFMPIYPVFIDSMLHAIYGPIC